MKNIKYSTLIALILFTVVVSSCTKNFEKYNTSPTGISDEQLAVDNKSIGAFFATMQSPYSSAIPLEVGDMGMGGTWAGYFMNIYPGPESVNYYLYGGQYSLFNEGYGNIMAPVNEVKRRGARESAPDFWAVALTLKAHNMQKVTDIYGPITYSEYGKGGVTSSYDSQEKVYDTFFAELDTAVNNFKVYIAKNPGAKPFAQFDKTNYKGDYSRWLKFANSTRLRMALQIVKVAPQKAKLQAEKAMDPANGGVITVNDDNAIGGLSGLWVPTHEWGDFRLGATVITYMNGYNDPRRAGMLELSTVSPGKYLGVRQGATGIIRDNYLGFSDVSLTNFTSASRYEFMNAAEVYFLRAEGALRGWNMGGTAHELYETGIRMSFEEWKVSGADTYINDGNSKPEDYVDPVIGANSMKALSNVTIKWDETATNERKLEKIVVQKYIAMFPDGTSVWSTYRRTGYPKQFPVVINNSGGDIDPIVQIRRMIYPDNEVSTNAAEVAKAIQLLGGPDKGSTRLWWDPLKPNF
jgi:hypothetical protein